MAANSLEDFILAFNACQSPKEVLRLVQGVCKVFTAFVSVQSNSLEVHYTSLAGSLVDECRFPVESTVSQLASKMQQLLLEDGISATLVSFLDDAGDVVEETLPLKDYIRLTAHAGLSPSDVGRIMYQAGDRVSVELLGECLGSHADFWKEVAKSYPQNFACFAGMDLVEAIRNYLWRFRLPGEALQIERIMEGFSQSYFHYNTMLHKDERAMMDGDVNASVESQAQVQQQGCWDEGAQGWYVHQPLSGPKLLPCCSHCGEIESETTELLVCQGCKVIHFCRKCRRNASRCGHAVVGMIGYGRACAAARIAAGTLNTDRQIAVQRSLSGRGELETLVVPEESLNWVPVCPFRTQDAVFVLAFSIIMLTTNLHSANVKEKMKKHEFIKQNRETNGGGNFPGDFLSRVYDDIKGAELKVMRKGD
jgi:hypothetical protein